MRKNRAANAWATLLLLILTAVACRATDDTWPQIEASGVLRIGVDPTFPPFAAADGDTLSGIDIDLGRALAAELGLTPQFVLFGYDGLYDALATRQVDVLISALVIAPERTRDFAYTNAYFDAGQYLVVPAGTDAVAGVDDLRDQTLAVELGALGHVAALDLQKAHPDITVTPFDSADEALSAVAAGTADAALVDYVSARLFSPASDATRALQILPKPVAPEPYAAAVRIGDRTLLNNLNRAFDQLQSEGQLEAILDKGLGEPQLSPISR